MEPKIESKKVSPLRLLRGNLTQNEFTILTGVSLISIALVEKGKKISKRFTDRLLPAFPDLDVDQFLKDQDEYREYVKAGLWEKYQKQKPRTTGQRVVQ